MKYISIFLCCIYILSFFYLFFLIKISISLTPSICLWLISKCCFTPTFIFRWTRHNSISMHTWKRFIHTLSPLCCQGSTQNKRAFRSCTKTHSRPQTAFKHQTMVRSVDLESINMKTPLWTECIITLCAFIDLFILVHFNRECTNDFPHTQIRRKTCYSRMFNST